MEFEVTYKQEGKRFSCYIPKIDTYFSAKEENDIDKKAKVIVEMWIKHHIITAEKLTWRIGR